jgi:hypothetical protein
MKTADVLDFWLAPAAKAVSAQGADEHVNERTCVRERARAGGNAAMARMGEWAP